MSNLALGHPDDDQNEIQAIVHQVKALVINTPQAYESASTLMVKIRKTRKAAEDALKALLKPKKDAIKEYQDEANVGLTLLSNAESTLQRGILDYQRKAREEQERKQAQENAKYEKRVEKAIAKSDATGTPLPIIAPPPVIAPPARSVQTEAGTLNMMSVKKWKLAEVSEEDLKDLRRDDPRAKEIPDRFFALQAGEITKLVRAIGKAGQPVPGCPGVEVYEEQTISVR